MIHERSLQGNRIHALLIAVVLCQASLAATATAQNTYYDDGPIDIFINVTDLYLRNPGDDNFTDPDHQFIVDTTFNASGVIPDSQICHGFVDQWSGGWVTINGVALALPGTVESPKHIFSHLEYWENDEFGHSGDPCDEPDSYDANQEMSSSFRIRRHPPYTFNDALLADTIYMRAYYRYHYTTPAPAHIVPSVESANNQDITVRVTPPEGSQTWQHLVTANVYRETAPNSGQFSLVCSGCPINSDLNVTIPASLPGGDLRIRAHAVYRSTPESAGFAECSVKICTEEETGFPSVSCSTHTAFLDDSGLATIMISDVNSGASSNCGEPVVTISQTSFTCADLGSNDVEVCARAGDLGACCLTQVMVVDAIPPTPACQGRTIALDTNGIATLYASELDGGSLDNCSVESVWIELGGSNQPVDSIQFDCNDVGTNAVTLIVQDAAGNTNTCQTTVEVVDDVPPIATCGVDLSFDVCPNETVNITADDVDNGSSDACSGIASRSLDKTQFTVDDAGVNVVTLTVVDVGGNVSTCDITVTINAGSATDLDNDGVCDDFDSCVDPDDDGICGAIDACPGFDDNQDADGDGVADGCDICEGFDDATDTDGDSIPDGCDACMGFDDSLDADGDLVADGCDACPDFDDGLDADGDSVPDACDVCPDSSDLRDEDGDNVPDGCDVCPGFSDLVDSDLDGTADGCDSCPGFDDAVDTDGDGVPDGCDACEGFDDSNDIDNDGAPDACDLCSGFPDSLDFDGDTIPDLCDVCDGHDDRIDSDSDGVPDGCDACPGFNDAIDSDGDGVIDGCDACQGHDAADFDGDSIIDGCDNCPDFYNPEQSDCDNNGVGDACEIYCAGTCGASNISFESGDLSSWVVQDLANPDLPLSVAPFPLSEGAFAAANGFAGETSGVIRLGQDFSIDPDTAWVLFDYVLLWDLTAGTLDRTFEVHVEPAGGGAALQTDVITTATAGSAFMPPLNGFMEPVGQTGMIDVSAFANSTVRLVFVWTIPEGNVGGGAAILDNIRCRSVGASCALQDQDADWIPNDCDLCPNTIAGTVVDSNGCEAVILGDMNCDGRLDVSDVAPFALALVNSVDYASTYSGCNIQNGDMNMDVLVNSLDIQLFINALTSP